MKRALFLFSTLFFVACGAKETPPAPPPQLEAAKQALAKGSFAEAGANFDLVCAAAPGSTACQEAQKSGADAWSKAADAAMSKGAYSEARRDLQRNAESADANVRKQAIDALAAPALVDGLRWEKAKALAAVDPRSARAEVEAIAALSSPVAAEARAWLKTERPRLLLADVRLACRKFGDGSCTRAFRTMKDVASDAPELATAQSLYDEEQRRIYKYYGAIEQRLKDAKDAHDAMANDDDCKEGCAVDSPLWQKSKQLALEFERLVRDLGDEEITNGASARFADAINNGVYNWQNPPPQPPPAPKEVANK